MARKLAPSLIALGTALAFADTAAAQSVQDRQWVEVSGYYPTTDTQVSVSRPGAPGTDIDLEADLAVDKHQTLPGIYAGARLGDRFSITGEFLELDRNGSRTLSRDLSFNGVTYPASVKVDSDFRSTVYRASVGYALFQSDAGELGVALGLHATDFKLSLKGEGRIGAAALQTQTRKTDFLAPLPTIGVFGAYDPMPRVTLNGRIDYLALKLGDYDGSILNSQVSIAYRVSKTFSVGGAYRYVKYNLDVEKRSYSADFDYKFSGPQLFLRLGFR